MRLASKIYQLARTVNTIEALTSGNPKRIKTRLKNIIVGRALARTGVWRRLYK